jgi:hypothetical protein
MLKRRRGFSASFFIHGDPVVSTHAKIAFGILFAVSTTGLAGYLCRHEVIGVLWNQPRFQGHPTSYWRSKVKAHPPDRSPWKHCGTMTRIPSDRSSAIRRSLVQLGVVEPLLDEPAKPTILTAHDSEAIPVLEELLADNDPDVRFQAAEAVYSVFMNSDRSDFWSDPTFKAADHEIEKQLAIWSVFLDVMHEPHRARELHPRLQELLAEKKGTSEYESWCRNLRSLGDRCGVDFLADAVNDPPTLTSPTPQPKESAKPETATFASFTGVVSRSGKFLGNVEVTVCSAEDERKERFTTKTSDDGVFEFLKIPQGKYLVMLSGDGIPAKYENRNTPLRFVVKLGDNIASVDVDR